MQSHITPGGKEIELFHTGNNIRARFVGGGELPAILAGIWTNYTVARSTIEKYLLSKQKDKNAK